MWSIAHIPSSCIHNLDFLMFLVLLTAAGWRVFYHSAAWSRRKWSITPSPDESSGASRVALCCFSVNLDFVHRSKDMPRWSYSRKSFHDGAPVWKIQSQAPRHCNSQCCRSIGTKAASVTQAKITFSGVQPTGVPHLGNLLGAFRPWVKLQKDKTGNDALNFSIVDLHALTVHQDPNQLKEWRMDTYVALLAVGLDPKISRIFFQSEVSQVLGNFNMLVAHASRCEDIPS